MSVHAQPLFLTPEYQLVVVQNELQYQRQLFTVHQLFDCELFP